MILMYFILALIFILAFAVLWGIMIYNQLVTQRSLVRETQGMLVVQLKRQIDLIPNFTKIIKEHAPLEETSIEQMTVLKLEYEQTNDPADRIRLLDKLALTFSKLFVMAENYPALKQSPVFIELQNTYMENENRIQSLRNSYNKAAKDYNNLIATRSGGIVCNILNFDEIPLIALQTENP